MRNGNTENGAVQCPFYGHIKEKQIMCEEVVKGQTIGMSFRGNATRDKYVTMYCVNYPKSCKLHKMLMRSYEERG